MIIEKEYTISVPVIHQEDQYSDLDEFAKKFINDNYIGCCYKSSKLIKFIALKRRSRCRVIPSTSEATAQFDCIFLAESLVYEKNEIVAGVKINNVISGNLFGTDGMANINVSQLPDELYDLKKGQYITILVTKTNYSAFDQEITVSANIFDPRKCMAVGYPITPFDPQQIEIYKRSYLWNKLIEIEQIYSKLDPEKRAFFENMLYRYKTDKELQYKSVIKNIKEFQLSNYVLIHPAIHGNSANALCGFNLEKAESIVGHKSYIIPIPDAARVYDILLTEYKMYMTAIEKMCNVYEKPDVFAEHSILWDYYSDIKEN